MALTRISPEVDSLNANNNSNTSLVVTLCSTTVGNLNIIEITGYAADAGSLNPGMTTPSGWTKVGEALDSAGSNCTFTAIYRKFYQSGDGTTVTINWTNAGQMVATCRAFSGADTTTPIINSLLVEKTLSGTSYSTGSFVMGGNGWLCYGFGNRTSGAYSAIADTVRTAPSNTSAASMTTADTNGIITAATVTKTATGPSTTNGTQWIYVVKEQAGGNIAPTANAGSDQINIEPYATVTMTGSGSDSDGSIVSGVWTQTSGTPTVTINNASTTTPNYEAPATLAGTTLVFRYTVTDNLGATGYAEVSHTILYALERRVVGGVQVPYKSYYVSSG